VSDRAMRATTHSLTLTHSLGPGLDGRTDGGRAGGSTVEQREVGGWMANCALTFAEISGFPGLGRAGRSRRVSGRRMNIG
jgi:hypothetical protein